MRKSLFAWLRSAFSRPTFEDHFRYFTDEERQLARMDVWQIADVIAEARHSAGMERRRIVAEHALSHRLARLQAKATVWAGALGLIGGVIGGAISGAAAWLI